MTYIIFTLAIIILSVCLIFLLLRKAKDTPMPIYMESWIGKRKIQEDCTDLIKFSRYELLAIISDGMGGYYKGKLASQFSIDRFTDLYLSSDLSIEEILEQINHEIVNFSYKIGIENKIGTTFLIGEILYNKLNFFSIGDSSLFLFRNKELTRLNKHHEKKGYLTNYLGYEKFDAIEKGTVVLMKNDILLMCSDGLDKFLTKEEIQLILKSYRNKSSKKIIEKLLENLKNKKSRKQDNVSIIVIKPESGVGEYEERGSKI